MLHQLDNNCFFLEKAFVKRTTAYKALYIFAFCERKAKNKLNSYKKHLMFYEFFKLLL